MRLLLRCNGFNNFFAVNFPSFCPSFFWFPFILFWFPFFLVGLEYCTLKSLEHFSFNSVRWGGSWYFRAKLKGRVSNKNDELYLHDHTNTYSISKAMFRNQNYNAGQLLFLYISLVCDCLFVILLKPFSQLFLLLRLSNWRRYDRF